MDLELKELLRSLEDDVLPTGALPAATRKRAQRRRAVVGAVSAISLFAGLLAGWNGVQAVLDRDRIDPATGGRGFAVIKLGGYPGDWRLAEGGGRIWAGAGGRIFELNEASGAEVGETVLGEDGSTPDDEFPFVKIAGMAGSESGLWVGATVSRSQGDVCGSARHEHTPGGRCGLVRRVEYESRRLGPEIFVDDPIRSVALGNRGAVWAAGTTRLYRINEADGNVTEVLVPDNDEFFWLDSDGDWLWALGWKQLSEPDDNGTITSEHRLLRIDLETGVVTGTVRFPKGVLRIAVTDRAVWGIGGAAIPSRGPDPTSALPDRMPTVHVGYAFQIDKKSLTVVREIDPGILPIAATGAAEGVWLAGVDTVDPVTSGRVGFAVAVTDEGIIARRESMSASPIDVLVSRGALWTVSGGLEGYVARRPYSMRR